MNNLENIRSVIIALTGASETLSAKSQNYCLLKNYLATAKRQGDVISDKELLDQIYKLANSDVMSESSDVQQLSLIVLHLFFKNNCINYVVKDIPNTYIQLAFSNGDTYKKYVKEAALNCLQSCVQLLILNSKCDLESLYTKLENQHATDMMFQLLHKAVMELPVKKCVLFYYTNSVSTMFETSTQILRDILIALNLELLPRFSVHFLGTIMLDVFKNKVKTCYIHKIGQCRNESYPRWHHLFKFLMQCFGTILHVQVDIVNDLLKIVEGAFRSTSIDDRYHAFDCWQDLIDNYSLDMDRLCANKQMKLIVTPLRTNMSLSNQRIIYKRFQVWTQLISVVQDKALPHLEQFLTLCFGNNSDNTYFESLKNGKHSKTFFQETTVVFLEIIGHYGHGEEDSCLNCTNRILKLNKPLINSDNFVSYDSIIVHSLRMCTSYVFQWMDLKDISKVITCLWGSVLNIIKGISEVEQEKAIQRLVIVLRDNNEVQTIKKADYLQYILKPILQLLMREIFFKMELFNKMIFFPVIKMSYNNRNRNRIFEMDKQLILELLNYSKQVDEKDKLFNQMYEILSKIVCDNNFDDLSLIWIEYAQIAIYLCNHPDKDSDKLLETNIVAFMLWPVSEAHKIGCPDLCKMFVTTWSDVLQSLARTLPEQVVTIISKLESMISPGIANTIFSFYPSFCAILTNYEHAFYQPLLDLTFNVLQCPRMTVSHLQVLLPAINKLTEITLRNEDSSTFVVLCNCYYSILRRHRNQKLLPPLQKFLDSASETFKRMTPLPLLSLIDDVKGYNNRKQQIPRKNESHSKISPTQVSRSQKIMAMTEKKVPSPKADKTPTVLQLFGQNVSSPMHNHIRGSQLTQQRTPLKKKAANKLKDMSKSMMVDDDNEANYVPIHAEYKFDKEKLINERETLKKPKSHIPALYQDLSQSQSNSMLALGSVADVEPAHLIKSAICDVSEDAGNNATTTDTAENKENKQEAAQTTPQTVLERVDLHVRNPSQEQIEAMITSNDESAVAHNCTAASDVKRRERVEKELHKLKLNIVGGDFVHNIDLMGKRSTRRKSDYVSFKQYNFLKVPDSSSENKKHASTPTKTFTSTDRRRTLSPRSSTYAKKQSDEITHDKIKKNSSTPTGRKSTETNTVTKRRNVRKSLIEALEVADDTKPSENTDTTKPVQNSEDIIESSQESHVDMTFCKKNASDNGKIAKQQLDQLISNIMLIEAETYEPIPEEVIEEHIDLTIDNQNTDEMETETLEIKAELTPQKTIDIPSSPVYTDTPTRTSELVTCTKDISPIKLSDTNHKTPDLFESETEDVELLVVNNAEEVDISGDEEIQPKSPSINVAEIAIESMENLCSQLTKNASPVENCENSSSVNHEVVPEKNDHLEIKNYFGARSMQLLKLLPWKPASPATKRITKTNKSPAFALPKDRRTLKIFKQCEKKLEFQKQDQNIADVFLTEDFGKIVPEDIFLEFVKQIPSPKASPRCSILKRKASEVFEEGQSPLRKKRVNFPDPPLTCKKLYYPDKNEHFKTSIDDDENTMAFNELPTDSNGDIVIEIVGLPSSDSELPDTETQGSVNIEDVKLLDCVEPIFPDLIDCKESIEKIAISMGDPMFANSLSDELQLKSIHTIGDLAKLTEVEINRLPIKSPKIKNLTTILSNFKTTVSIPMEISVSKQEQSVISQPKQQRRISLQPVTESNCNIFKPLIMEPILPTTVLIPEIQPEDVLRRLVEDFQGIKAVAIKQGVNIAALCKAVINISEPNVVIDVLRESDSFKLSSIIKENDWPRLLKEIVDDGGLKKLIFLLSEVPTVPPDVLLQMVIDQSVESYKGDTSHLQQAINHLIELTPLSFTLNHLGLDRVVREVHNMCTDLHFSTEDFFKYATNTFTPSLEEMVPCFRHINVVNLESKLIKRDTSEDKDLFHFIDKLLGIVDNTDVCLKIPKKCMLTLFNVEELTEGIVANSNTRSSIESCEKLVQQLPKAKVNDDAYKSLALALFDKIPTSDLCRYFAKHLDKFACTVQNPD